MQTKKKESKHLLYVKQSNIAVGYCNIVTPGPCEYSFAVAEQTPEVIYKFLNWQLQDLGLGHMVSLDSCYKKQIF